MSHENLSTFDQIKKELRIDSATGVGYCSIRGAARIGGIDESSLRESFQSAGLAPSKLAQRLTAQGFEGAGLAQFSESGIPDIALAIVLEYYAFHAGRYCNGQARAAYLSFGAIGIRTVIQKACGKPESDQTIAALKLKIAKLEARKAVNITQRVTRDGMERQIQAIRCEMDQVKASMGMEYPEEARFIRDGMVKRMMVIVRKTTRKLPSTFVAPGQLELGQTVPVLSASTKSKAKK